MARADAANHVRYWQDGRVPGLFLLHADFTRHDFAPHTHEALVVAVTESGGSEFHSRGQTQETADASVLVFNPQEPHSNRMGRSPRWRYRAFYLRQPAIEHVAALAGNRASPYFTANRLSDRALAAAFLALHRAAEAGDDPLLIEERLAACFGTLIARHGAERRGIADPGRDRAVIAGALALIHDGHAGRLGLDDLGRETGLTAFQLIRLFKRVTGLTPHGYLTQVRLGAAVRRLERGAALADAAVAAGFYDQSAFTRRFRQAYGITPLHYVRAIRGQAGA